MDTNTALFTVEPIPAGYLDPLRAAERDDAGHPLRPFTAGTDGGPLRCCLRESRPNDVIMLIAYQPPGGHGPYAEWGPVFVHASPCKGYLTPGSYPPEFRDRRQVLRAYDDEGRIADAVLVADQTEARQVIGTLLARSGTALLQSRNIGYGCYMFAVRRTDTEARSPDGVQRSREVR